MARIQLSALSLLVFTTPILILLAACADRPPADDKDAVAEFEQTDDPLEPMNRDIFAFNMYLDHHLIQPGVQRYHDNVPDFIRERLADFIHNLQSPLIFVNDVLQGNSIGAGNTLARFGWNTIIGVGGLFDAAPDIPRHEADAGETFGVWGIGEGPYLVLPILGPSNPRDAIGTGIEGYFDPVDRYLFNTGYDWAVYVHEAMAGLVRREENLDTLAEIERTSIDPYSAIRSLYRQYRKALIEQKPGQENLVPPGYTKEFPKDPELSQETQ